MRGISALTFLFLVGLALSIKVSEQKVAVDKIQEKVKELADEIAKENTKNYHSKTHITEVTDSKGTKTT